MNGFLFPANKNPLEDPLSPLFVTQEKPYRLISRTKDWPKLSFCIVGPRKSGLTTLLRAWAAENRGSYSTLKALSTLNPQSLKALSAAPLALDDCEQLLGQTKLEESLLILFNMFQDNAQTLLLASHEHPSSWSINSPDLRSRFTNISLCQIPPLPLEKATAWLELCARARHMRLPRPALNYILRHITLDYASLVKLIAGLDEMIAEQNIAISRHSVRQVAEQLGLLRVD